VLLLGVSTSSAQRVRQFMGHWVCNGQAGAVGSSPRYDAGTVGIVARSLFLRM
jgi:hypothetical protein